MPISAANLLLAGQEALHLDSAPTLAPPLSIRSYVKNQKKGMDECCQDVGLPLWHLSPRVTRSGLGRQWSRAYLLLLCLTADWRPLAAVAYGQFWTAAF